MDLTHEMKHQCAIRRIELAGDLVGQEDSRSRGQHARERRSLLLAAGEVIGAVAAAVGHVDLAEEVACSRPRQRPATESRGQADVLDEVERRNEILTLEHDPDGPASEALPNLIPGACDVDAVEEHSTRRGPIYRCDEVEERALPGPGPTHHRDELAGRDVEVHAAQCDRLHIALAVDLDDILESDRRSAPGLGRRRHDRGRGSRDAQVHRKLSIIVRNASTLSTPSGVDRLITARPFGPGT